jgi:probable rRNA maturation factor
MSLVLRNRQKTRSVDIKLLREITSCLLRDLLEQNSYEIGIHLVTAPEMAKINEGFLQHEGSTDVITFDYSEGQKQPLYGEIFICVDDAIDYAKQFKTSWQSEVVRYVVHGVLHLLGYDDLEPVARRKMKVQENRLHRELARRFTLNKLQKEQRSK